MKTSQGQTDDQRISPELRFDPNYPDPNPFPLSLCFLAALGFCDKHFPLLRQKSQHYGNDARTAGWYIGPMDTEFLDRLAKVLKSGRSAACQRTVSRLLSNIKKRCEEGEFDSPAEAEGVFRNMISEEPACKQPTRKIT
jgi:hypothetical protein